MDALHEVDCMQLYRQAVCLPLGAAAPNCSVEPALHISLRMGLGIFGAP